jgi:hypothetical protein
MQTDTGPFDAPRGAEHRAPSTALGKGSTNELREAVEDAASALEQLYRVCQSFLERQASDQPYAILGASFGVGFVLGGGLASRVGGVMVNAVGRAALAHSVDAWAARQVATDMNGVGGRGEMP